MEIPFPQFDEIWVVDFEFRQADGDTPSPVCMVAKAVRSGLVFRLFGNELTTIERPPFEVSERNLFVAYYSPAEWSCFLELDWMLPTRIIDLYSEFRCLTSGLPVPCGHGLLGALVYYGLRASDATEKESMRQLAMRGAPYSSDERRALVAYCESDVDALHKLLLAMHRRIDLAHALIRGRYTAAVARMERTGTPIDVETLQRLLSNWDGMREQLIRSVDRWEIWNGLNFNTANFISFLQRQGIPWPALPSGAPALDDDTFRSIAKTFPVLWPIRELRHALSSMRLNALAVGPDGRNRCMLSPFGSKTGRNQPSNTRFIFGPSVWLRGLIKPAKDFAIAYIDWEQQEFGIAAALSGDKAMVDAYVSGDPYLAFAKQAGAIPAWATRESHGAERERFKVCALSVLYGIGEASLGRSLGESPAAARDLLRLHRQTYSRFWEWSRAAVDFAMLHGYLETVFGWRVHAGLNPNPRSLANFPMQGNGAEMLRLACCLATESGISVCAPVHDALLIESHMDGIDAAVQATRSAMGHSSEIVLDGFPLRTECKIVRYPDRFADKRGTLMWETVMRLLSGE